MRKKAEEKMRSFKNKQTLNYMHSDANLLGFFNVSTNFRMQNVMKQNQKTKMNRIKNQTEYNNKVQ